MFVRSRNPHAKPRLGEALIDGSHPLAYGLVGAWLFNEGAGLSAYGIAPWGLTTGTLGGATLPTWTVGPYGTTGLAFTGASTNNYVTVPCAGEAAAGPISMVARVLSSSAAGSYQNIVSRNGNSGWRIRLNQTDATLTFLDRGGTHTLSTTDTLASATVYTIGFTASAAGVRIFINGRLSNSDTTAFGGGTAAATADLLIGSQGASGEGWQGTIFWEMKWNVALTDAQHLAMHATPFELLRPPLAHVRLIPHAGAAASVVPVLMSQYRQRRS